MSDSLKVGRPRSFAPCNRSDALPTNLEGKLQMLLVAPYRACCPHMTITRQDVGQKSFRNIPYRKYASTVTVRIACRDSGPDSHPQVEEHVMSKQQEMYASLGISAVGIAGWALLVAYLTTRFSFPGVI